MDIQFLLVAVFLLLFPLCFLIGRTSLNTKTLLMGIFPSLIATVIYTEMAIFWAGIKVISFDRAHLIGGFYRLLPVEYYVFVFSFSFAGLGVYNWLNVKFPNNNLQGYSLAVSNLLLGISIAFLFFAYTKWYTVVIFGFLLLLLFFIEYRNELRFMYRFYRAFAALLLPFLLIYGWLSNTVLQHHLQETAGLSVFNTPFESMFMMMGMLLLTVFVYEFVKARTTK